MQNKILSLLVDNTSGVLSRIAGMFSRRGYNIDSITAGVTADVNYTRITVVCSGDDAILVEFCGFKQGKDLLEEYQYASVFVLPTREDCFGLVLLEAACTGTPIVTSKYADGAYDIITENVNGSIIDPYNAEEFGKTIESILRNPEKYRADKKIFDKFSFESVSKGYVDAIEYTLKDN